MPEKIIRDVVAIIRPRIRSMNSWPRWHTRGEQKLLGSSLASASVQNIVASVGAQPEGARRGRVEVPAQPWVHRHTDIDLTEERKLAGSLRVPSRSIFGQHAREAREAEVRSAGGGHTALT